MHNIATKSGIPELIDGSTCPVCACTLKDEEELHICDDCETPHHKDCWDYIGGCAIFGCRKGVLRKFEEDRRRSYFLTTFNLKLMHIWGKLLYVDLVLFLAGQYSSLVLVLGILSSAFVGLTIVSFPLLAELLFFSAPVMLILWYLMLPFLCIFGLALSGWFLTRFPIFIMMIHFWMMSISVSSKKMETALQIASRVELPEKLVNFGNRIHSTAQNITSKFVKVSFIMFPILSLSLFIKFGIFSVSGIFLEQVFGVGFLILFALTLSFGFLNIIDSNCMAGTQLALRKKLTFISAFQNRLIASAKQSKG